MSFTSESLNYKGYAYKNSYTPLKIVDETIHLSKTPQGEFIAPAGQILLKINYASLNPVDYKLYHLKPFFLGWFNDKQGFGRDFSGEVISIGENTSTKVKVGDFVQGIYTPILGKGTTAQYLLLDPKHSPITTKPTNIDLAQAAAWPLVLGTAYQLSEGLNYKDSKVLVLGAGTSVGRNVVQLASLGGAREVVTTNSKRNSKLIEELGATSQIDYRKHPNFLIPVLDSVKQTGKFDYIIDTYGGTQLFPEINNIINKNGYYRTIVGDVGGHNFATVIGAIKTKFRQISSSLGLLDYHYEMKLLQEMTGWIEPARDLVQDGKVKIFIDNIYPFDELKQAVERLESGKAEGKVLVEVAKPAN